MSGPVVPPQDGAPATYAAEGLGAQPPMGWAWHPGGWTWLSRRGWEELAPGWVGVPPDAGLVLPARDRSLACFECGLSGHFGRDCPRRLGRAQNMAASVHCWLCGSPHHLVCNCPQNRTQGREEGCWICHSLQHVARERPEAELLPPSHRCWHCGSPSHLARECGAAAPCLDSPGGASRSPGLTQGAACWWCGRRGHSHQDCPTLHPSPTAAGSEGAQWPMPPSSSSGPARTATVEYASDIDTLRLFLAKRPRLDD